MNETEEGWGWNKVVTETKQALEDQGLPMVSKPVNAMPEFLNDVEKANSIQLANMAIRHQGWYSYATTELAISASRLKSFEEIYEVKLGEAMYHESTKHDSRITKEVLKSLVISQDNDIKIGFRRKVELDNRNRLLEGLVKGLEIRCKSLESEQIRRATIMKVEGGIK